MGTIGSLLVKIGGDARQFNSTMKNVQRDVSSFGSSMKNVGGMLAGVFVANAVADFGKEITALAGKAEGVGAAFEKLNEPFLLDRLKKSVGNTVSEVNLMARAVQAKNFRIPLKNLGSFFQFATKRAEETGESVDYLVESIINGIGRKSPLILDNLGISAIALREEIAKVGDFGKAAGNIINTELEKQGPLLDTATRKTAELAAEWENFKTLLGQGIAPVASTFLSGANTFLKAMKSGIKGTVEEDATKDVFNQLGEKYVELIKKQEAFNKQLNNADSSTNYEKLNAGLEDTENKISFVARALFTMDGELRKTAQHGNVIVDLELLYKKLGLTLLNTTEETQDFTRTIQTIQEEIKSLKGIQTVFDVSDTKGLIAVNDELTKLNEELKYYMSLTGQILSKPVKTFGDVTPNDVKPITPLTAPVTDGLEKTLGLTLQLSDAWKDLGKISIEVGDTIREGIETAIGGAAEAFGELMVDLARGTNGLQDFGSKIITIIADFVGQFGQMLIASGVATLAFESLLANPFAAIAAGAALVGLAAATKKIIASGPGQSGGGGSVGASTTSAPGNFVNNDINIKWYLQGSDMAASLSYNNRRTETLR